MIEKKMFTWQMKNAVLLVLMIVLSTSLFASSTTKKARNRHIEQNGYEILCEGNDYTLVKDKNGTFYLYSENWLTDDIYVYMETEEVTKDFVANKMNSASSSSKRLQSNGYTIYYVSMGLFSNTYYFVKTPKGNYYSVSKSLKTIHADGNNLIEEL